MQQKLAEATAKELCTSDDGLSRPLVASQILEPEKSSAVLSVLPWFRTSGWRDGA